MTFMQCLCSFIEKFQTGIAEVLTTGCCVARFLIFDPYGAVVMSFLVVPLRTDAKGNQSLFEPYPCERLWGK